MLPPSPAGCGITKFAESKNLNSEIRPAGRAAKNATAAQNALTKMVNAAKLPYSELATAASGS